MRRASPRLTAAVTAAAAVALAGCIPQDPDDVFYFLGRVTDVAGAGLAGATVTLETQSTRTSGGCGATDRLSIARDEDSIFVQASYAPMREATANEDGFFYFDLMRFEITPASYSSSCFAVFAQGPGGGNARSTSYGTAKDLVYPDLAIWDGASLGVAPGAPASVGLPPLPWTPSREGYQLDEYGSIRRVLYDWTLVAPGDVLIWHQLTEGDPLLLEPEVVQDFSGLSVRLESWNADTVLRDGPFGSFDYTDYRTVIRTPPVAISVPGTVPISRGAACTVNGEPLPGCPLTDGSAELVMLSTWLDDPWDPRTGPPPDSTDEVVLELAQPVVPRLLVVHEIHGPAILATMSFTIEGWSDSSGWLPLAPDVDYFPETENQGTNGFYGSGAFFKLDLDSGGEPIRKVKLTTGGYTGWVAAREISVFD